MSLLELILSVALLMAIAYWASATRAVELARKKSQQRCRDLNLIHLDDSVALKRIHLQRNRQGHIELLREYQFEFISDGEQRYSGEIILSGNTMTDIIMEAYRTPDHDVDRQ